ncbi:hypothetical protein SDC9_13752 [bioreactor metagenome]|uniref:Uncharacterized protein n=1 Tax=bioreactor metagenome TaxID=1076179 RepID=A0A644TN70_9ZZZZ|nr:hypothetical protein [Negativicutes bacterium]
MTEGTEKLSHFMKKISDRQEASIEDSLGVDIADDDLRQDCCDEECPCPCPCPPECPTRGISIANVMQSLKDID